MPPGANLLPETVGWRGRAGFAEAPEMDRVWSGASPKRVRPPPPCPRLVGWRHTGFQRSVIFVLVVIRFDSSLWHFSLFLLPGDHPIVLIEQLATVLIQSNGIG